MNTTCETQKNLPLVLDACCGPRNMWFDKRDSRAVFVDRRRETHELDYPSGYKRLVIDPDIQADFTDLPFPDDTFAIVVMDPPHVRRMEALGCITKKYGVLVPGWEDMLRSGFAECFRVLRPGGTLIFKWCEVQIPLARVLALTPERPLFGHNSGVRARTHWVAFLKAPSVVAGGQPEQAAGDSSKESKSFVPAPSSKKKNQDSG